MTHLNWRLWLYNLLSDSIRGGANAVTASSIVALNDPVHYSLGGHSFYTLVASVFLTHAVINLSHYLETKPLPELETSPEEQTPASRASEPSAKV